MTLRRFILPLVLSACPAFSQTAIMGHHLGESIPQFLAEEPGLQSRIEPCRASEPKPLTPEQIRALSKQDAYAVGEQVFATVLNSSDTNFRVKLKRLPSRGELEDLAKQGMPIVNDKRMPDVIATCHSLIALSGSPTPTALIVRSLPNTRPHPVTWHFKDSVLSQIDIDFHGAAFSEVAGDISSKLQTKPDQNKEIDTPNLYGATLHVSRKATWLTQELYALLEDEEGLADGQLHFSVITRAEYDAWTRAHSKKSALD
ncbi:hypothetical protein [Terriglobus tenax]|uniref:hypothetical protein n=1 Tax=Terriglobus tenax TaxID=1111115 RepID=UPI0021DF5124|nr:hypothetical protein [Terriglobus tenax]